MADKTTHFGRAGEFFAMSELLLRGWNVAVPVVDVGDDVFVVDDNDKTTYRMQVKSAEPKSLDGGRFSASFSLSRRQLKAPLDIELFYMLLVRTGARWRYLIIPRDELAALRDHAEAAPRAGRSMVTDIAAKTDALSITIDLDETTASLWGQPIARYLDRWPEQLPVITDGPGKRSR